MTLANAPSLEERAYRIRRNALRMGEVQGQGYIAQALGVADVLATAYFHALRYRPEDPEWDGRDRFLLSIGHYAIALYAVLIEAGIVPTDELETYGTDDLRAEIIKGIPLARLGVVDDIGNACLFLAPDLSAYITGATIDVNGGMLIH